MKLDDEIKNAIDSVKKLKHIQKVLCTPEATAAINQLVIDHYDAFSFAISDEKQLDTGIKNINWKENIVEINNTYIGYYTDYDNIAEKVNMLNGGTSVRYVFTKETKVDDITFKISDYLVANLPDDDILLLKRIGKIKETLVDSHIDMQIQCGIN